MSEKYQQTSEKRNPFMNENIVTLLRNSFAKKDYPMLQDHCESCAIPKDWGGHHDNCLYDQAAYEIERLRKIISDLKSSEMCDPNDPCEMCKE